MGCLLEAFFQIVYEVILEIIFKICITLTSSFVPEQKLSSKLRGKIKKIVEISTILLLLSSIIGFFLFLYPPSTTKTVGTFLLFIPLGIFLILIFLRVIIYISNLKNN